MAVRCGTVATKVSSQKKFLLSKRLTAQTIKMLALRKLINKPKLTDSHPLAVFYYCDEAVNHQMQELNHLMKTTPDNLDRRATLIRQLKEAQHNLMNVVFAVTRDAVPEHHTCRDFRAKYPDDVLVDQINGPLWFGAECIAAGSHILNHELESEQLRPFAIKLSKTISRVRAGLKEQCLTNRQVYNQKLKDMLVEFDVMWADFEFRYVGLMCSVKSERQYYHQQDVIVLFCESTLRVTTQSSASGGNWSHWERTGLTEKRSILRVDLHRQEQHAGFHLPRMLEHEALKKEYIDHDMIEMMDPSIMFAIPRLAIVCGLVICPDGPINPSRPTKELPPFFRGYQTLLGRIKELLSYLTEEQLVTLEKALCSSEGLGSLTLTPPHSCGSGRTKTTPPSPRPLSNPSDLSPSPLTHAANSSAASSSNPVTPNPPRRDIPSSQGSLLVPRSSSHQRSRSLGSHDLPSHDSLEAATENQTGLDLPAPGTLSGCREGASNTLLPSSSQEAAAAAAGSEMMSTCESGSLAVAREGEPFPQFSPDQPIVNDLPMATPIISPPLLPTTAVNGNKNPPASPPTPTTRQQKQSHSCRGATGAGRRSGQQQRSRGPAGFASAEDLMHRLFVAISGVADQLQTNHAKDLRVILKHVFAVCLSEPEEEETPVMSASGKVEEEEEDFMVQSTPHLSDTEGLGFGVDGSASSNWVPDSDCLNCTACHEPFSWRRRRHHCRTCGQVVCARCSPHSLPVNLAAGGMAGTAGKNVRVCNSCYLRQLGMAARVSAAGHTHSPPVPHATTTEVM